MSQNIEILDGGLGHMIKRLGVSIHGSQPGAIERFQNLTMSNIVDPEIVQNAHIEFLRSGCDIITTNNYGAIPKCLPFDHLVELEQSKEKYQIAQSSKISIAQVLRENGFFERSRDINDKQVLKYLSLSFL